MIFGTFDFFIFFAVFLFFYWLFRPWPAMRSTFLAIGSLFYYFLIDRRFVVLIAGAAVFTYLAGAAKTRFKNKTATTLLLGSGITINLLLLFWFKYYDFFRSSAQSAFASVGLPAVLPYWEIVFPIGISFFTFRMISYLIDVCRQKYDPETSLINFFAYALFFPCLLAGPIIRADDFLPQIKKTPAFPKNIFLASSLFFFGLFKKIILSTWIAASITDNAFAIPEFITADMAWMAMIGYTLQIYCDFSGYSDIAIACAMFLGFEIKQNFDFPYKAQSIGEFWRRWHISFYSWMRDYVYIPLGGNRNGKLRNAFNILFVFILSGLWHGAAGHFLIWGIWHGIGLIGQRIWNMLNFRIPKIISGTIIAAFAKWLATFMFVGFGWIFFRSENIDQAKNFLLSLFKSGNANINFLQIVIISLIILFVILEKKLLALAAKTQQYIPETVWPIVVASAIAAIYYFAPETVPPFIYFSF